MDVNARGFSLDKDCLAGKFVLLQKSERPKTGCAVRADDKRCVYCMFRMGKKGEARGDRVDNEMIFANKN